MEGAIVGFATADGTVKEWHPEAAKQRKREFVEKVKAAKEYFNKSESSEESIDIDKILNDAFKKNIEDYL